MREAIGNTFIFNVIITFVIIFIIIFAGSASYSKAAKVKNTIIDVLVQNSDKIKGTDRFLPTSVTNKIDSELKKIGYRVNKDKNQTCRLRKDSESATLLTPTNNYRYCVWRVNSERGYYFKVVSYMYFEVPLLSPLEYPIEGESRVIYEDVQYKY